MVNQVVENNDYEMVPGTVHLIDINGNLDVQKMVISFYSHNQLIIQMTP